MTAPAAQPDDEPTQAEHRAARELANRLAPWIVGMQNLEGFAARFVADLRAEGWRPPLGKAPDWREPRAADPDVAHRGAHLARQALNREDPA